MPRGFHRLIAAQFFSSLADNALLILAIALLQEQGHPGWWAPLLKFFFTLAYVLLAPFVGPLADALPKGRLMAWMNGLKVLGVLAMLLGLQPLLAFAIVGLGAAAYSPAKYGLVTELVGADRLVAANGWIEVSTVLSILFGTLLGGVLISQLVLGLSLAQEAQQMLAALTGAFGAVDTLTNATALALPLLLVLLVYGLAALLNLGIPDSGARYPQARLSLSRLLNDFAHANRVLWRDPLGGLSLAITTLFWGVGATMQFAVLRWSADVLGLELEQAAYLQAVVAVGVVAGASLAGQWVPMHRALVVLPAGVALGLLLPVLASSHSLLLAVPVLVLVGAVGGLLVVPMNALLQHRGYTLLTAGRSIAVQNFNENLSILVMLAVYAALIAFEVPVVVAMWLFGLGISVLVGLLMQRRRLQRVAVEPA